MIIKLTLSNPHPYSITMKTFAEIAQLTENNDHSTAMVESARRIINKIDHKLLKAKEEHQNIATEETFDCLHGLAAKEEMETILFNLKRIRDRHHLLNQLVAEDYHERYELYSRMMEIIKDIDEDFYKKLYACL
jgi:DNA topoisomerase VI subunit B